MPRNERLLYSVSSLTHLQAHRRAVAGLLALPEAARTSRLSRNSPGPTHSWIRLVPERRARVDTQKIESPCLTR